MDERINWYGCDPLRLESDTMLLYHVHLPTLDSLDVLQFNDANLTVTMDNIPTIESFIDRIRRLNRRDGGEDLF